MHCGSKNVRCCLWRSVLQVRFLIWMIDSSQASSREYCNYSLWGLTYMGSVNVTEEGLACQRWDSNWPHAVASNITDATFPDGSKSEGQNFCRNPYPDDRNDNSSNTPWCYTIDPNVSWQYCKPCRDGSGKEDLTAYNACALEKNGAAYSGSVAFTKSGFTCDLWSQHRNSTFVFPDGSAKKAKNYCRNPIPTSREGPWCYTTSSDLVQWDYCDVCIPFLGAIVRRERRISKERVKLPSMPLANCLHWCITFMSCVGIDFKRDEVECWYSPYNSTTMDSEKEYDHYDVERICPEMAAGSMSDGRQAVERTRLLQKHHVSKTHRIPETVFEERNMKAPHPILLVQKLKRGGIERPGQLAPADGAVSEISANRSAVREGSEREASIMVCGETLAEELQTESTYWVERVQGTPSRSGNLLRQKRSQTLGEPDEQVGREIQERDAAVINRGVRAVPESAKVMTGEARESEGKGIRGLEGYGSTAETIHSTVEDVLFGKGTNEQNLNAKKEVKKSKLAASLSCLMIVMAAVVFISTMYACVKTGSGKQKKTSGHSAKRGVAKPEAGTSATAVKPNASERSLSSLSLRP